VSEGLGRYAGETHACMKNVMPLSAVDFEHSLKIVRAAAEPRVGVFGPASMTWRVDREAAVFLGAGRALLLQLAHPWVAAAIADRSNVFADPLGRFQRTFNVVFTLVFGTLDQALAVARRLHLRHAAVEGVLPTSVGPFAAGSPYCANDVAALRWVHATLVETAVLAYDLLLPPLADGERDRYWSEAKLFASLFGIPQELLAPDWKAFTAYTQAMMESDGLTVSPTAREVARLIFSGRLTGVRVPMWYQALTAQMLPERLRIAFALPLGEAERRSANRALGWLQRIYPLLPDWVRTVGPYQEAQARLRGKVRLIPTTRWLNRLWIGEPSMGSGFRETA
jgi:uncharacterized protein (DUF2236 family)